MASSERKDMAIEDQAYELPSFYKTTDGITSHMKVELDALSKRLILRGRANGIPGEEAKSALGQRYVMVGFIKENIVHLRAIPGFGFIADEAKREETAKKAMAFFNCDRDHVAFTDHQIWTGVVHQQLISLIEKKEPKLVVDAKKIAFSMCKKANYTWLNRSVINASTFPANPLAVACYAFDEKITEIRPEFDLLYHLTRSIPMEFFREIVNAGTEIICEKEFAPLTHSSLDECTNTGYEIKWQALQELFKTNKPQAVKKIQQLIMRNLHIYLSDMSSIRNKEKAQTILVNGLNAAEELNIPIDISLIPPEFEGHPTAIDKSSGELNKLLTHYEIRFICLAFSAAEKKGNIEERKSLIEKYHTILSLVIDTLIKNKNLQTIDFILTENLSCQDDLCDLLYMGSINYIHDGFFSVASKILQLLAAKTSPASIQTKFKKLLGDKSEFMSHFAQILLEEKPNYNMKNAKGKTLLHIAIDEQPPHMIETLATANLVDANILNQNGDSCLIQAAKNGKWDAISPLLRGQINLDVKDEKGKSALEYVLEHQLKYNNNENLIADFLSKGAILPDSFLDDKNYNDLFCDVFYCLSQANKFSYIPEIIRRQNLQIQTKLQTILFPLLEEWLKHHPSYAISIIIEIFNITSSSLRADFASFNQKIIREKIVIFFGRTDSRVNKLTLLNAILDEKSAIGKLILKEEPSLRFFDKTPEKDFRTYLHDMRETLQNELLSGHDHTSIP